MHAKRVIENMLRVHFIGFRVSFLDRIAKRWDDAVLAVELKRCMPKDWLIICFIAFHWFSTFHFLIALNPKP